MASCPRIDTCPLFKQFQMRSSLAIWKGYYCEGDFGRCERWLLVSRGDAVPTSLLPNGRHLDVPLDRLEAHHLR